VGSAREQGGRGTVTRHLDKTTDLDQTNTNLGPTWFKPELVYDLQQVYSRRVRTTFLILHVFFFVVLRSPNRSYLSDLVFSLIVL